MQTAGPEDIGAPLHLPERPIVHCETQVVSSSEWWCFVVRLPGTQGKSSYGPGGPITNECTDS